MLLQLALLARRVRGRTGRRVVADEGRGELDEVVLPRRDCGDDLLLEVAQRHCAAI
jgi:hypothetical protein